MCLYIYIYIFIYAFVCVCVCYSPRHYMGLWGIATTVENGRLSQQPPLPQERTCARAQIHTYYYNDYECACTLLFNPMTYDIHTRNVDIIRTRQRLRKMIWNDSDVALNVVIACTVVSCWTRHRKFYFVMVLWQCNVHRSQINFPRIDLLYFYYTSNTLFARLWFIIYRVRCCELLEMA